MGVIEFYNGKSLVALVYSSIVPHLGALISIRGEVWRVENIAYALDHADDSSQRSMRANVDIVRQATNQRMKHD